MKNKLLITLLISVLSLGTVTANASACANDTPHSMNQIECENLKKFVDDAILYYQAHGDEALPVLGDPRGGYRDGELYIFVLSQRGIVIAHAGNPWLVNRPPTAIPNGEALIGSLISAATADGGWAVYDFANPETGKVEEKHSWVKSVEDVVIGSGLYD